ncbi:taste receptor type 2 member 8-like [Anolis carolinensis]|uniref:taste receptor type 2 member 8-like n=1 Tax=Anolis carolinensis TaxID=28377 RepID=UPI000462AE66|nr:PREDICTED: taste receptor type 2 member 8-like [Anolis carolinensis]|eukprot:XP_008103325.1 PREDICTED: taste receptor type 2 member 8-like [Anolis carolinensis]
MFSLQITAFLVVAADLTLGGLISNGFIATVIIRKWIKCRSLASSEQLLLVLGISNVFAIILQTASVIGENVFICSDQLILPIIFFFVFFVTFFRFWLTAWLSLFYCIKIVNSTHVLLVWCKMRISWLIHRLLLGSLLISLFISFFAFHEFLFEFQSNRTASVANRTQEQTLRKTVDYFKVLFLAIGTSCPLLVVLFCSILSIVSLCRHIHRMTREKSSFRSIQAEAHLKAAQTMLSLLFFYVLFYVGETLSMTIHFENGKQISAIFVVLLYSHAQAAILVLVNSKLKRTATQILLRISQELCRHTVCSQI